MEPLQHLGPLASIILIFISAAFTDNILLARFLGMCSCLGVSKRVNTSVGLGLAVIFVTASTAALNHLVYQYILVPLGLEYLRLITFIIVIAAFVQLVEMVVERISLKLYFALGIFLPLITVNCAILGTSLFMVERNYMFWEAVVFGAGSGVGWLLAIVSMAAIRQKLKYGDVPEGLQGFGINMIVTGLIAMAFMLFSGITL